MQNNKEQTRKYIHPKTRLAVSKKEYFDFIFSKEYDELLKPR
jgi:hypothetical protein